MKQSYQELTDEIVREIAVLSDYEPQAFFWFMKHYEPKRFERMTFDTNGSIPYSEVLSEILSDLVTCRMYDRPWKYKSFDKILIRRLKIEKIKNNIK